jgi:TPR repeat protein
MNIHLSTRALFASLCVVTTTPVFAVQDAPINEAELTKTMELCATEKADDGTLYCLQGALNAGILYEESCDKGNFENCHKYAVNMLETHITKGDFQDIGVLFEKACNGGFAESCTKLSFYFREGWRGASIFDPGTGLEPDLKLAVDFAKRGCTLGSTLACYYAGVHAYNGLGMDADVKAAIGYFDRVCAPNSSEAVCAQLDDLRKEATE